MSVNVGWVYRKKSLSKNFMAARILGFKTVLQLLLMTGTVTASYPKCTAWDAGDEADDESGEDKDRYLETEEDRRCDFGVLQASILRTRQTFSSGLNNKRLLSDRGSV
jgi:hypothetical protein